jgi:hypothetical protein
MPCALPDGQITSLPVWGMSSPAGKNIPIFRNANQYYINSVLSHLRGVSRTSRTRGGMRWTRGGALTSAAFPPSLKLRRTGIQPGEAFGVDGFADGEVVWS